MSGTKPPSPKAPATDPRWPTWKLALLLYPFVAAAVAINLFMVGLIGNSIDLPSISPVTALLWSVPLGIPVAWLAGRWVRRLMDAAS